MLRSGSAGVSRRIVAKGAETPFQLQLPKRFDTVEFNALGGVLCGSLDVKRL